MAIREVADALSLPAVAVVPELGGKKVLIVTAGKGIIATEDREVVISPGDVVLIPANEKHWHGATEDSEFSHIYLSNPTSQLTQLEA